MLLLVLWRTILHKFDFSVEIWYNSFYEGYIISLPCNSEGYLLPPNTQISLFGGKKDGNQKARCSSGYPGSWISMRGTEKPCEAPEQLGVYGIRSCY